MQAEKIKVILADDNLLLCTIVSEYLQAQSDIELIDVAHNGDEACEKIRKEKPHMAILDCAMPMVDGLGVLERLSNEPYRPICIMLSGIRSDAVTKRAYDLGADYYIIKPFDLDVLADRIRMFRTFTTQASSYKRELEDLRVELNLTPPTIKPEIREARELREPRESRETPEIREIYEPRETPREYIAKAYDEDGGRATIEEQVTELLHEIGVPANIRGYRCLRTAIMITIDNLDLLHFVTKKLYPSIAVELNTTPSSVERAIRHAIGLVWEHGNIMALDKLFGYSIENRKKKPSNSEFIALIADKFRLENKAS
ncbi:MAG: response regulator [Clostridiales bacterium]|nr:response regulator [Clostridiales bacterium]